jgi:hypothetical protein
MYHRSRFLTLLIENLKLAATKPQNCDLTASLFCEVKPVPVGSATVALGPDANNGRSFHYECVAVVASPRTGTGFKSLPAEKCCWGRCKRRQDDRRTRIQNRGDKFLIGIFFSVRLLYKVKRIFILQF